MPYIARVYYIEILQLIANRNTITLVCYLAQTKTVIPYSGNLLREEIFANPAILLSEEIFATKGFDIKTLH